jgi:DNA gyrase subunit B
MSFSHGVADGPLEPVGEQGDKKGTEITFLPSPETFSKPSSTTTPSNTGLRELAFLNSGVFITVADDRGVEPKSVDLHYEGGISAFVQYLDRAKQPMLPDPISITTEKGRRDGGMCAVVERQLPRERPVLHQQHPAA